jgi:hypothetical protein
MGQLARPADSEVNAMDDLERRKEEALVYVSLSTATLITCFAVAFALI